MAGGSKLHDAVRHDRCRLISRLVAEGVPVDDLDANGNTALFVAITDGPVSAVPYLLQAGADPNFRCSGGATPVHAACRRGSRGLLQQLLECGGDLRLRDSAGRTPQDWALGHADPQCRRKLVAYINTRRALAYRFGDAAALLEDESGGGAGALETSSGNVGGAAAASLRRRFGRPARRFWCTERIKADGGFGVVYLSPSRETGVSTFVPFVPSNYLYSAEDSGITWSGPQSLIQTMYWDKLKVSVKKSSLSGSHTRGPCSDVLITELDKIRKLTYHPYLLWPLAVSPVQNMDDVLLVFECVHFGSLFDVLHNAQSESYSGPLNRQQLLLVLQQACEALLFLHSRRWVHGCVSSHCVYVVSPCLGKLGGFEFVQPSENGGRPYSPPSEDFLDFYYHWMAPEVLAGRRPTTLSDLYQFCAVLWELFADCVPWEFQDRATVERSLTEERVGLPRRSELPPPLDTLVYSALSPEPGEREIELDDVYHALSAIVQESMSNMGFLIGRLDNGVDGPRIKSTPGRTVLSPPRQPSAVDMFVSQRTHRRPPSTIPDDVSDTMEELISLADEQHHQHQQQQQQQRTVVHCSPPVQQHQQQQQHGARRALLTSQQQQVLRQQHTVSAASAPFDLLGPKFDQISLSSSLDPMDFTTEVTKVPTFSSRQHHQESRPSAPVFEQAVTQTDARPPLARPRTRGFVPTTATTPVGGGGGGGSVRVASRFTDTVLLTRDDTVPKSGSVRRPSGNLGGVPQQQQQQQMSSIQQSGEGVLLQQQQSPQVAVGGGGGGSVRRSVRPCKPASHSYGVSPFMAGTSSSSSHRMMMATTSSSRTISDAASTVEHTRVKEMQPFPQPVPQQATWRVRPGGTETRYRQQQLQQQQQQVSYASRGTSAALDVGFLEGLEDGQRYHKELTRAAEPAPRRMVPPDEGSPPQMDAATRATMVADQQHTFQHSLAMMNEEGDTADSGVKSVQTEPNHAYKVEVVTMTCPVIQHTLTVTSTNLLTGETTVTEESTGAEMVQVQWNPEQINITTPDTSLNSSSGAGGNTSASASAVPGPAAAAGGQAAGAAATGVAASAPIPLAAAPAQA
ncbi:uncharacterized protein LOC144165804 [Haemaphysalis longicornis]